MIKYWKKLFCAAWMPVFFGGDSDSQANTTSTTTNTNFVTSEDKRVVASDEAVGISGSSNVIDRSTTQIDTSNRSTNFQDVSDRSSSTVINNTTTDFGSIQAALGGMTTVSKSAIDMADHSITGAISSLKNTGDNGLAMVMAAFNNASKQSQAAEDLNKGVMAFSADLVGKATNPDGEINQKIMLGMIAAVAAVGVAIAMRT